MARYLVDTPAKLDLVRIALDQANGLRDNAGRPTPRQCRIFRNGVEVTGTLYDPATWGNPVLVTDTVAPPVLGDDGTAALELPLTPEVEQHLGKTIRGQALPRVADLVTDETQLPARVQAAIQARRDSSQSPAAAAEKALAR